MSNKDNLVTEDVVGTLSFLVGSGQDVLMNRYVQPRPYADPDVAARKLLEIANAHEPCMDGRILIERLNGAMLFEFKATPAE
jgi:hypothetical protein